MSANQVQLSASLDTFDTNLNLQSFLALNDRELDVQYVYGTKYSPDGSLRFQPTASGIDVFDGMAGVLLDRISLPFELSTNYDALVSDGRDNVLLAIAGAMGTGIAIVDLSSLPEPSPLASMVRSARRLSAQDGTGLVLSRPASSVTVDSSRRMPSYVTNPHLPAR